MIYKADDPLPVLSGRVGVAFTLDDLSRGRKALSANTPLEGAESGESPLKNTEPLTEDIKPNVAPCPYGIDGHHNGTTSGIVSGVLPRG